MRGRPGSMSEKHTLGVVKETRGDERRVSVVPESVAKLAKLGFDVVVERGAGAPAGYEDEAFEAVGARIGSVGASCW